MTRDFIEECVERWLPRLRLTHWAVKVDWNQLPPEGDEAECLPLDSYDVATLRFGRDFSKWDARYAEGVVVHELLHLVTRDLQIATDNVQKLLPKAARPLAESVLNHEIEGVVDRIAAVLVAVAAP
jgi:hypothetical protein